MKLLRPTKSLVESYIGIPINATGAIAPDCSEAEWFKSHRDFVVNILLPEVRPPTKVWQITVEAYLTDVILEQDHPKLNVKAGNVLTFEQAICDGSSVVPDIAYRWGNIKDPWSMGHDLLYLFHKCKLRDVFDRKWSVMDAHRMYRDGWLAQGNPIIGNAWFTGLVLGGWVVWNMPFKNKPEPLTGWEYKHE